MEVSALKKIAGAIIIKIHAKTIQIAYGKHTQVLDGAMRLIAGYGTLIMEEIRPDAKIMPMD
jgi:hypothetical protein